MGRETQMRAGKWARALNFWWIINLSGSDIEQEIQKIAVRYFCI